MKEDTTSFQRLEDEIVKAKEKKFGLKYDDRESEDFKSYQLYSSFSVSSYQQYKHYASFYGNKVLSKKELFRWYKMFFEVRTDCIFAQDSRPSKDDFLESLAFNSTKWTKAELKSLKDYVMNEVPDDSKTYYEIYGVAK